MDRWELAVPNREDSQRGLVLLGVGVLLVGFEIYDSVVYGFAPSYTLVAILFAFVVGWRIRTMGLYVSQRGVRIRLPYHTRTYDWFEIRDFESKPLPPSRRLLIWVVLKMGEPQRTSVPGSPEVLDQLRARLAARSVGE
ncbi:hypothetical protein [Kibdelosporangium aridum]|uniref:PH domain-containing protein n=1 Tax=Kibdelosporangium aridum TaxID=2030 RepID=A0A1W2F3F7_KIBAR|nr:hypothetical protein [Kibdelosporangium aridum]SMD16362.1 hypothetical protein SAMN05661093_05487 [Kibdelosporangium aridum]